MCVSVLQVADPETVKVSVGRLYGGMVSESRSFLAPDWACSAFVWKMDTASDKFCVYVQDEGAEQLWR